MLKGFGLTPKSVHNGTFSYSQICPLLKSERQLFLLNTDSWMNRKNMESGDFLGKTDLLPNLSPFRNAE